MARVLMLIDANSLLNRAYFGLGTRNRLTAPDGTPTGALYAFLNMLLRYLEDVEPDAVCACYDRKEATFRHEFYADYKGTRTPMDDDLAVQLPISQELLSSMGICWIDKAGYEADDLIGTLAKQGTESGFDVVIVTGDKDSFQLIRDDVQIIYPVTRSGKSEKELVDRDEFFARYGIQPEQFVDLKALMGDSSDNIPGVRGIGEKTGLKLLQAYETLDGIYEHLDKVTPRQQKLLKEGRDAARLSRELAAIATDVPIDSDQIAACSYDAAPSDTFRLMLERLGFRSIIERLGFDRSTPESIVDLQRIDTLTDFLKQIDADDEPLFLTNDFGQGIVLARQAYCLLSSSQDVREALQVLPKHCSAWSTNDWKRSLRTYDVEADPSRAPFDLALASYLLGDDNNNSSPLASTPDDRDDLLRQAVSLRLQSTKQRDRLNEEGSLSLARDVEMPLAGILANMERCGVQIDMDLLEVLSADLTAEEQHFASEIATYAGGEVNLNSPQQLGDVLYGKLGLPPGKKLKSGIYSTANAELERLYHVHPIVPLIIEYREVSKLRATFIDGLRKAIQADGRVHTTYNQMLTSTGRLSSSNPNLQNIPIRTARGARLRDLFIAAPGCILLDADYSQVELRLLAHLSGDPLLVESFKAGQDVHVQTATKLFDVPTDRVSADQRAIAKTVNFSIIYGISEFGLARDLGISFGEAKDYIDNYNASYPQVRAWMTEQVEKAKRDQYVETLLGRRRYIPELKSSQRNVRMFGERAAMNAPVQGTAADLIKVAMVRTNRAFHEAGLTARLILQIHDELIVECPPEEADQAAELMRDHMENALKLDVPLVADVRQGRSWGEAH